MDVQPFALSEVLFTYLFSSPVGQFNNQHLLGWMSHYDDVMGGGGFKVHLVNEVSHLSDQIKVMSASGNNLKQIARIKQHQMKINTETKSGN